MCVCVCVCVCDTTSSVATGDTQGIWRWNENIVFDISVRDVPRGARLCLAIYAVYGNRKAKKKPGKSEARGVNWCCPSN